MNREPSCVTKKYVPFTPSEFNTVVKKQLTALDTTLRLWHVDVGSNEMNEDWFLNSDQIVAIYSGDNIVDYYANKYDRDGDYRLELENREYFSAWHKQLVFGPITVPFKYRLGYVYTNTDGNRDRVKDELTAGLNIGLFAGYQLSRYRTRYESGGFKNLPQWGVSIGPFFTVSAMSVDSSTSVANKYPLTGDNKISMGIFSPGGGITATANNICFGLFLGWDLGFGQDAKRWDYNNKMWVGFGLNYNLGPIFWQKGD